MQQTFLEGRNDMADGTPIAWMHSGYALKVALVYQDALTRQWAGQVRDRMAEAAGKEAIRCTEWGIPDLVAPRVFSEGVAALAQADVIVVSVYEAERLPPDFYLWVNVWLQERSGLPGALIALVVPPEEPTFGANETRRYLCAVASQGHLEFLMQECKQPGEPIQGPREDILEWSKAA